MMRKPLRTKRPAGQEIVNTLARPAPVLGWNARDPEASMPPGFALKLENWFPTTGGVEVRPGAVNHVTGFAAPVKSLMAWNAATGTPSQRLFAATDSGVYDASVAGAVGASVATLTNGAVLHANYRTSGNSYLFLVNGTDDLTFYDGTTWATDASYPIAGGGTINTNTFAHINVFKRRLFFVREATLDFVYLDIDSIGGDARIFPLGGIFTRGGFLMAMATWTIDGGAGVDDLAVFVTSEGQVAVYQGTNPNDANAWSLIGVYDLSPPIGRKCFLKYGGDVLLITESGVFPLSKAFQSAATNPRTAITDTISGAFAESADDFRANYGWQAIQLLSKQILLVNVPEAELATSSQYIMNTLTGAWMKVTGWNSFCFEVFDGRLFMGMTTVVAEAWVGRSDFTNAITATVKTAFDYFGTTGRNKKVKLLRPVLRVGGSVTISVAVDVDFLEDTAFNSSVFIPVTGDLWDTAIWDTATWGADATMVLQWLTVAVRPGRCAAIRLRVITSSARVFWSATDLVLETGNIL